MKSLLQWNLFLFTRFYEIFLDFSSSWKLNISLKFKFSKKAAKLETISHMIWNLKSSGRLFQIFVAFSECPNFKTMMLFRTVLYQLYCFRCSGEVSWGNISLLNRAKKAVRCSATEPHHRPCTRACPPAATPPPWCIYAAVLAWPLPHGHSRPQPPLWPQPVQPSLH